jgi:hypothetical protein
MSPLSANTAELAIAASEFERRSTDRRAPRAVFRVPERRTGFDRRAAAGLLSILRDSPAVLVGILLLINLFSLTDWALTMKALSLGAVEGNPVLATMMTMNPVAAFMFKLLATLLVTLALWTWRRYRLILATAAGAALLYAALMMYHFVGIQGLLTTA